MKLGQKVKFSKVLVRKRSTELDKRGFREYWRRWHESEIQPTEGIVTGVRNLRNGVVEYIHDEGYDFMPTEKFNAYVVSFSLHRRPVFVLPEHLTILN